MGDTTGGKLTANQERYVQELIKPKSSQRKAYYIAYPHSKKWKETSVDCEASKLIKITKVKQRFEELKEKADKKANEKLGIKADEAVDERAEMIKTIKQQIRRSIGEEPTKTVIKELINGEAQTIVNRISLAVDLKAFKSLCELLAKLEGWIIDKVEHSGIINSNEVSGMTEEELELEIVKQNDILKRTNNDKTGDISSK